MCQLLGGTSIFIQNVVVGWFTYDLTGSRILTSMSWGIDSLSNVISGPIGGLAADKWERKKNSGLHTIFKNSHCCNIFISNNLQSSQCNMDFVFRIIYRFLEHSFSTF